MKHFYQSIQGMMDYEDLYSDMVKKFNSGLFVEIGVWYGRSAAYMATEIYNSNKQITLDIIDNFKKSPIEDVKKNLAIFDFVNVIQGDSSGSAKMYYDNSIDFIFIDADHSESGVTRDIKAWLPKLKKGGVMAGHDYGNPRYSGVKKAVDSLLNVKQVSKQCWYYDNSY